MSKFAKLIDLEDGEQVLLYLEPNADEDTTDLSIMTHFYEFLIRVKIAISDEQKARSFMNDYTVEKATEWRKDMLKSIVHGG